MCLITCIAIPYSTCRQVKDCYSNWGGKWWKECFVITHCVHKLANQLATDGVFDYTVCMQMRLAAAKACSGNQQLQLVILHGYSVTTLLIKVFTYNYFYST